MMGLNGSQLCGEFEVGDGVLVFVDETGSLYGHQIRGVPSVQMTPEDPRPIDPRCPSVVSFLFLSPQ